ncbi:hypothetical protein BHM03_00038680 [Ensete ventricosum]|nr:hypothetical protein BHM03_00038680 [Ensete ventricosum]
MYLITSIIREGISSSRAEGNHWFDLGLGFDGGGYVQCPPRDKARKIPPVPDAVPPEPPPSSCISKQRHQIPTQVQRHYLLRGPNQLAADEHGRHRRLAPQQLGEGVLHLRPARVLVELMDGSADTELMEQALHAVAEAAVAPAEDHHRPLRRQLHHLVSLWALAEPKMAPQNSIIHFHTVPGRSRLATVCGYHVSHGDAKNKSLFDDETGHSRMADLLIHSKKISSVALLPPCFSISNMSTSSAGCRLLAEASMEKGLQRVLMLSRRVTTSSKVNQSDCLKVNSFRNWDNFKQSIPLLENDEGALHTIAPCTPG